MQNATKHVTIIEFYQHDTLVMARNKKFLIVKHGLLCYKIKSVSDNVTIDQTFKSFRKALIYLSV